MSYSRWMDSRWYTYWDAGSGQTKDEQIFHICMEGSFTYAELAKDVDACLDKVCAEATKAERCELLSYMLCFMEEMEGIFSDERLEKYEALKKKITVGTCFRFRDRPNEVMEVIKVEDFDIRGGGRVCFVDDLVAGLRERWEDIHTIWGWMQGDYNPLEFCNNGLKRARDIAEESEDDVS